MTLGQGLRVRGHGHALPWREHKRGCPARLPVPRPESDSPGAAPSGPMTLHPLSYGFGGPGPPFHRATFRSEPTSGLRGSGCWARPPPPPCPRWAPGTRFPPAPVSGAGCPALPWCPWCLGPEPARGTRVPVPVPSSSPRHPGRGRSRASALARPCPPPQAPPSLRQVDGQGRGRAAAHPGHLLGLRGAGRQQPGGGLPVRVRHPQLPAGGRPGPSGPCREQPTASPPPLPGGARLGIPCP